MSVVSDRGRGPRVLALQKQGSLPANPQSFVQRAAAFAAGAGRSRRGWCTSLVVFRDQSGLRSFVVLPPGASAELELAHAVGARLEPVPDGLPVMPVPVVGWLEARGDSGLSRSTQAGVEPGEVSRVLGNVVSPGCWVVVTLRQPSRRERSAHLGWVQHQLGSQTPTHHSRQVHAVAASLAAGGVGRDRVEAMVSQVAAVLPGFDVSARVRVWSRARARAGPVPGWWQETAGPVLTHLPDAAAAGGGVLVVPATAAGVCAVRHAGVAVFPQVSSVAGRWWQAARKGGVCRFPSPPRRRRKRHGGLGQPGLAGTGDTGAGVGVGVGSVGGGYPLHAATFLVGPEVVAGLVAPQAGAVSGTDETRARQVPPQLHGDTGWCFAADDDGAPVSLNMPDVKNGVAVLGDPETGKTKLLQGLWATSCLDRVAPSGRDGFPGASNSMVAFESKGWRQVADYRRWAGLAGDDLLIVDVGDADTCRIDLFPSEGTPGQRANQFLAQMVYGFDDGDIKGQSREVIQAVLTAAVVLTDTTPDNVTTDTGTGGDPGSGAGGGVVAMVRGEYPQVPADPHPIWVAHALACGSGDGLSQALFTGLRSEAVRRLDTDPDDQWAVAARDAVAGLSAFMEGTSTQRRQHMQAARNKFGTLRNLDVWWDRSRPAVTWEQIVCGHWNVVVNFGASRSGWEASPDGEGQVLAGMLLYRLRQVVAANCDGWQADGRWVSVFTDELAQQVGSQPEVVSWLKDEGRAFGVRMFAATQRLAQLEPRVRDVLLTFETVVCFRMKQAAAAEAAATELASTSDEWSGDDVQNLPPYAAAVRTMWQRRLLSTFVTPIPQYDADRDGWAARWGYRGSPPPNTDTGTGTGPNTDTDAGPGSDSDSGSGAGAGGGVSGRPVPEDNVPQVPLS